jgi:hypothetical protein
VLVTLCAPHGARHRGVTDARRVNAASDQRVGDEIAGELRLRLIEAGGVQLLVFRFLQALARAFYGVKVDKPESLMLNEVPSVNLNNDTRGFLPSAGKFDVGAEESVFDWRLNL